MSATVLIVDHAAEPRGVPTVLSKSETFLKMCPVLKNPQFWRFVLCSPNTLIEGVSCKHIQPFASNRLQGRSPVVLCLIFSFIIPHINGSLFLLHTLYVAK